MRRSFVLLSSLVVLPAIAQAQRGGMPAPVSMARPAPAPFVAAPRFAARAPAPMPMAVRVPTTSAHPTSGVRVVPGTRWVRNRSGNIVLRPARPTRNAPVRNVFSNRGVISQDIPVPGLGFDFAHFAATHPDGLRDRHQRGFVGEFVPFFGGGGFFMPLFPDDTEETAPAEAPPQQVEAENAQPRAQYPYPYATRPPEPAPTAAPAAPERPAEQFVFVRRDGTVFFAVAYAWDNGTLRYVTSEGLGRSLAGSQLDLAATQQFNEQRGLIFHAPA